MTEDLRDPVSEEALPYISAALRILKKFETRRMIHYHPENWELMYEVARSLNTQPEPFHVSMYKKLGIHNLLLEKGLIEQSPKSVRGFKLTDLGRGYTSQPAPEI